MLTTHDMEEADQPCDRVAIVDHGRLVDATVHLGIRDLRSSGSTLESVFVALTGRDLRE